MGRSPKTGRGHRNAAIARSAQPRPDAGAGHVTVLAEALQKIRALEGEIAQSLQGMQEKVRQLEVLNEFSSLLNSSLDTDVVREKALQATCSLLRCETASLLLVDAETQELYWETALGDPGKELKKGVRLKIDEKSIAGYVAMTGETFLSNDIPSDPRHNRALAEKTGYQTRTMVCAPLRIKDGVVGVLQAINKLPSVGSSSGRGDFVSDDLKLLETLGHQVAIAIDNAKLYSDLKKSFYETVEALAESIEKKDRYTGGHTKRVVYYSMCIAKYVPGLSQEQLERIRLGALLHDVGKIGVEDKILKKEAPLEVDEWKVMQRHPDLGYDIMSRVTSLKDVIGGMRFHHERWDGKGYPLGLKGDEIPLIARIIAVADTYDAMVSTRPYRKGLSTEFAHREIVRYGGTQFDPMVVEAFVKAFENEKMGKGSGGSMLSNCD